MDFKDNPSYSASFQAADKLDKLDLKDPTKDVIGNDTSLAFLMQSFVNAQAQTNHNLLQFLSEQTAAGGENITINDTELTATQQKVYLTDLATKQNLIARQLEKSLQNQIQDQHGLHFDADLHLINPPPTEYGTEQRVSDTGLKLIPDFSGDTNQNESNLNLFLRSCYALAHTANLTEQTTLAVILRKLVGSAHELIDQFVTASGGADKLQVQNVVHQLEKKFLVHCSPISAEAQLHALKQGTMTYSQLQARVTKLAKLATRLEHSDQRDTLTRVKECSSFLMAISSSDRLYINGENARRSTHSMAPMTLDQMSDSLSQHAADKMSFHDREMIQMNKSDNLDVQNIAPVIEYQKNRNGRGQDRPNFNANNNRRPLPISGQPNNLYQQSPRQGQFKRFQPRPDQNMRRNLPPPAKYFVTPAMAGVEKNSCLLCGDPGHLFKSEKCVYAGATLMKSPCRFCGIGCHAHASCVKNKNKSANWPRPGRF